MVVWNRVLRLTQLYGVVPDGRTLLLYGGWFQPKGRAFES